jgi:hypothetical protein
MFIYYICGAEKTQQTQILTKQNKKQEVLQRSIMRLVKLIHKKKCLFETLIITDDFTIKSVEQQEIVSIKSEIQTININIANITQQIYKIKERIDDKINQHKTEINKLEEKINKDTTKQEILLSEQYTKLQSEIKFKIQTFKEEIKKLNEQLKEYDGQLKCQAYALLNVQTQLNEKDPIQYFVKQQMQKSSIDASIIEDLLFLINGALYFLSFLNTPRLIDEYFEFFKVTYNQTYLALYKFRQYDCHKLYKIFQETIKKYQGIIQAKITDKTTGVLRIQIKFDFLFDALNQSCSKICTENQSDIKYLFMTKYGSKINIIGPLPLDLPQEQIKQRQIQEIQQDNKQNIEPMIMLLINSKIFALLTI